MIKVSADIHRKKCPRLPPSVPRVAPPVSPASAWTPPVNDSTENPSTATPASPPAIKRRVSLGTFQAAVEPQTPRDLSDAVRKAFPVLAFRDQAQAATAGKLAHKISLCMGGRPAVSHVACCYGISDAHLLARRRVLGRTLGPSAR